MKILFICEMNVNRSQMAETFFNHFSKKHTSKSAGLNVEKEEPIKNINVMVTETMNELGFDLSNKVRVKLTPKMVEEADVVVAFTEMENLPDFVKSSKKLEFWNVDDPHGKDYDFHKRVRDQMRGMVKKFVEDLETLQD